MSKFFRSVDSSSSESSSTEEDDDTLEISNGSGSVQSLDTSAITRITATNTGNTGQEWLLHSLLEDRCITQVRAENQTLAQPRSEAEIQQEGRRRYRILCSRLAPLNLVSVGPEDDRHVGMRQNVRDRLDSVQVEETQNDLQALQLAPRTPVALPMPLRRLLTESDVSPHLSPGSPASIFSGLGSPVSSLPPRYSYDFEEIGVLGKGGYGEVFHVRHHLDGRLYAVKKVPIRPAMIAHITSGGEAAMNELLAEVRSLSRLDHPNVVRYFNSWIEWSTRSAIGSSSSEMISTSFSQSETDNGMESLHRVKTESDTLESIGFSFETQSRPPDTPSRHAGANNALVSMSGPSLALHMQMDVYPMTLADFLSPNPTAGITPLAHCFHLEPSVAILMAILDGVEYLHAEGIVHRDLKPANIFLRHETNPRATSGCVDLFLCPTCRAENRAEPVQLSVRIGDFGLVTNIAETATPASPVGTDMYRPRTNDSVISPRLDTYAVGVIACELLCKFETQMERRTSLHGLRQGKFPKMPAKVRECVACMLGDEEVTAGELKKRLAELSEPPTIVDGAAQSVRRSSA